MREDKLGNICEFKYGKALPEQFRRPGSVSVFGSNGVVGYHDESITVGPTIIIGRKGSIGEVNISPSSCWPIDTTYYVDKSCTKQDLIWLSHALRGLNLAGLNKATGVPGLNRNDAYEKIISIPPICEQHRIAAILDQVDDLRRKRQRGIQLLDDFTRASFIELFGDPASSDSRWPEISLQEFFRFRTGKLDSNAAVPSGKYPFFTCAKEDFWIDKYAFECEALLLAGNNANADYSVKHYVGKFNAYQRTYVITLLDDRNSYQYGRFALEYRLLDLKKMSKGTNTKYLTLELLNKIRIPLPPVEVQQQFSIRAAQVAELRSRQKAHLLRLEALFASLQHRAFTGKLTARQAERELEMAG